MMNPKSGNGVVYVAPNASLLEEACVSAASLRKHHSDIGVVIFTDEVFQNKVFDHVSSLKKMVDKCCFQVPPKLPPLRHSPFEKTLYLDGDTYVCGNLQEIFDLLDQFDVLTTHAPIRDACKLEGLGPAFPEFNGGFLAYRNSIASEGFLVNWMKNYETLKQKRDQPALRKTLHEMLDIRFYVLPPEFNLRINAPAFIGGGVAPKIFHGRHDNFEKLKEKFAEYPYPRVAVPKYSNVFARDVLQVRSWGSIAKELILKLAFWRGHKH